MKQRTFRLLSTISLLLLGLANLDTVVATDFVTIGGVDFESCRVEASNATTEESCTGSEVALSCYVECFVPCGSFAEQSESFFEQNPEAPQGPIGKAWSVQDGVLQGAQITVESESLSEDTLRVFGLYQRAANSELELSLFRFTGDRELLADEQVSSVFDLVAMGLIDPSDIVFVETDFPFAYPLDMFEFEVDVTGVEADELFVLASGIAPPCSPVFVPAAGPYSLAALAVLLLAASWRRAASVG